MSITRHDDEAWLSREYFTNATEFNEGLGLQETENVALKEEREGDKGQSKTGLTGKWQIKDFAEIYESYAGTKLKLLNEYIMVTNTLAIRFAPHRSLFM